jgi:hypothetical protein
MARRHDALQKLLDGVVLDQLAGAIGNLSLRDIATRAEEERQELEAVRADQAELGEREQRLEMRVRTLDLLHAAKTSWVAEVAAGLGSPDPWLDRITDPTGQQAAVCAVVQAAERPMTPAEIHDALRERGFEMTLQAVQSLLSRMARQEPPLLTRPRRGRYDSTAPLARTSTARGRGGGTRTHVPLDARKEAHMEP